MATRVCNDTIIFPAWDGMDQSRRKFTTCDEPQQSDYSLETSFTAEGGFLYSAGGW
ncbi:hypothetical protein N826_26830 [Skermanella aerolata KACC 11604]|jgi:hypothetical protein|nr:hypothetical protein N826_26830 [Skermanella aerolata KACC 11604]